MAETPNLPSYETLLQQVKSLTELHSKGVIQNADPQAQAAYVNRLQQQAVEIKRLLALLNSQKATSTSSSSLNVSKSQTLSSKNDVSSREEDSRHDESVGYESLWEVGAAGEAREETVDMSRFREEVEEVGEGGDVMDDQHDLYENTGVSNQNVTCSVEFPPPLPPRLPSLTRSGTSSTPSLCSSQPGSTSLSVTNPVTPDCSTPLTSRTKNSLITSTPKISLETGSLSLEKLKEKREQIISSLQSDERERQWHYSQLELISQKIRSIPLSSVHSYSLENEVQRQQLEERAARVQSGMVRVLGSPTEVLRRRKSQLENLKSIDQQLLVRGKSPNMDEEAARSRENAGRSVHPQSCNLEQLYHEALPLDKALSHSGPAAFGNTGLSCHMEDTSSVISFTSSVHSLGEDPTYRRREDLDTRVEAINTLMTLLGCSDVDKMSKTFLAMSSSPANCDMMRTSRCIPLLVQLLHTDPKHPENPRPARQVRTRAARSLHNIVHAHPNDKHCKREAKVLKLLEVLRQYCDFLRDALASNARGEVVSGRGEAGRQAVCEAGCRRVAIQVVEGGEKYSRQDLMVCDFVDCDTGDGQKHVFACHDFLDFSGESQTISINIEETMAILTRCSFDESHRQPIFLLGGIPALAELMQVEHAAHGSSTSGGLVVGASCREVRRYAVVALTNLTFGNANIKSFLCSFPGFVPIMVGQLQSPWENLRKATAHLFRNLAWKADKASKAVLSDSNVVGVLMAAAMSVSSRALVSVTTSYGAGVEPGKEEPTLKVILSALWNLSAHCRKNKADVCGIEGALQFLVSLLRSRSTAIIENGGGILRNVSSYIATCEQGEQYRSLLRDEKCLSLLLGQLRSPSLTIVSNACGTLWNFSARSSEDQALLWELGAVPMLQSLTNSKHKTISTCSLAALKNLYSARPAGLFMVVSGAQGSGQLQARKVKNLVADLDEKLSDCGGNDVEGGGSPRDSPGGSDSDSGSDIGTPDVTKVGLQHKALKVIRSESRDSLSSTPSVTSNHSDIRSVTSANSDLCSVTSTHSDVRSVTSTHSDMAHDRRVTQVTQHQRLSRAGSLDRHPAPPDRPTDLPDLTARPLDLSSGGRKQIFLRGMADVVKQGGVESHALPNYLQPTSQPAQPPYQNVPQPRRAKSSSGSPPPPLPRRGEAFSKGTLSAEGRFDGHFTNFMKQYRGPEPGDKRLGSPLRDNYTDSTAGERVMSPSKLQTQSLPTPVPLDLTTKKTEVYSNLPLSDEVELGDEKPTDYSLRFQESEEPELPSKTAKDDQLFDDHVKTYYTEGTPLDTPYAFSTATSMSDLREPAIEELVEEEAKEEARALTAADTTTAYAEEGTPMSFSRADSLSSLEGSELDATNDTSNRLQVIPENGEEKGSQEAEGGGEKQEKTTTPPPKDNNHKTVTFRGGANNPHDTPLMFSRASSVASLDSFDQQSIPDGYSSYEQSRATSGRVSPSDLPDSPSQTMPGSPRRTKMNQTKMTQPPLAPTRTKAMFEDGIKGFAEEGTPGVFSTRTSLSGLSFEDEDETPVERKSVTKPQDTVVPGADAWREEKDTSDGALSVGGLSALSINESEDGEEDDIYADSESILEAVINSAMPNSRSVKPVGRQSGSRLPLPRTQSWANNENKNIANRTVTERLNESGGGSDESCCSAESSDILEACIASAMPSKTKVRSVPGLGPRQAAEGAPSEPNRARQSRSQSHLTAVVRPTGNSQNNAQLQSPHITGVPSGQTVAGGSRLPPPPPERRGSSLSHQAHPCAVAEYKNSAPAEMRYKGDYRHEPLDMPRSYGVEDTPINFSAATSLSDLTVDEPQSGRISVDSNDGLLENKKNSRRRSRLSSGEGIQGRVPQSGGETPHFYATEDTPAVFSRNDSLSSLESEMIEPGPPIKGPVHPASRVSTHSSVTVSSPGSFQSHLPRPSTVGRSESSGSSSAGVPRQKTPDHNSSLSSLSTESLNNTNADEEDLLASCIFSAMPKSKSEHYDLAGKTKKNRKSPSREKSKSKSPSRRSTSKSPRGSRLIPGVVIPELRLIPRTSPPRDSGAKMISNRHDSVDGGDTDNASKPNPPYVRSDTYNVASNSNKTSDAYIPAYVRSDTYTIPSSEEPSSISQVTTATQNLRISELPQAKVPSMSENQELQISTDTTASLSSSSMWDQSPNCTSPPNIEPDMAATLTQSRLFENMNQGFVWGVDASRVVDTLQDNANLYSSITSSVCSEAIDNLSLIQPPSLMLDSLPSLTDLPRRPSDTDSPRRTSIPGKSDSKLECRHTLGGKLGSSVPVAVRRALGKVSQSIEDLSSLSSCQSNLDNVRPPTIMDDMGDMDNSMVSVASISSEVAVGMLGPLAGSGGSDDTSATSLTSEAILDIVRPAGAAVEAFNRQDSSFIFDMGSSLQSVSVELDKINPPTLMEEVTVESSKTLVAPAPGTYPVDNDDHDDGKDDAGDTCADAVTDVFDEESVVEPTLTAGSDAIDSEVPELPRDSRGGTPAHSGGESSRESTPQTRRKLSPKEKRQMDRDRFLTYTKSPEGSPRKDSDTSETSGYRTAEQDSSKTADKGKYLTFTKKSPRKDSTNSTETLGDRDGYNPESPLSSRQQRLADAERFKTRTISKEDINPAAPGLRGGESNSAGSSPKSIKQRRSDDGDRFKTHTIRPEDVHGQMSAKEAALLEAEAKLVVATITEKKASARSRSTSVDLLSDYRSRSCSVEILGDEEMEPLDADTSSMVGGSREELQRLGPEGGCSPQPARPRICKPGEMQDKPEEPTVKAIRGRRRALYSPPLKRATIPPAVAPKPSMAPSIRPRTSSSPMTSPRLIRGTRATALRQASSVAKKDPSPTSPRSPKISPRSLNSIGSGSSISPRTISSPRGSLSSGKGGSPKSRVPKPRSESQTRSPSHVRTPPMSRPALVRQGTFTKDESPANTSTSDTDQSVSCIPRLSPSHAPTRQIPSQVSSTKPPPKIAPKPMFRRDQVQPLPAPRPGVVRSSPRPGPVVATTKTQALREASLSRGGPRSSTSSTSSAASRTSNISKTSIRTSSSSHSLRNAAEQGLPGFSNTALPRRTPSSSDIERRKTYANGRPGSPLNKASVSQSRPMSPSTRPISAASRTSARPISPFTRSHRPTSPAATGRLGMRPTTPTTVEKKPVPKKDVTSKIASLWKKVEDSKNKHKKTDTVKDKRVWITKGKVKDGKQKEEDVPAPGKLIRSGTYEKLTEKTKNPEPKADKPRSRSRLSIKLSKFSLKRRGANVEDQMNGNTPLSPEDKWTDDLGNSISPTEDTTPTQEEIVASLQNPCETDQASESSESMSTGPDHDSPRRQSRLSQETDRPRNGRIPTPTKAFFSGSPSAIVTPFNYTPSPTGLSKDAQQLKRNASYVSSMGRKKEGQASQEDVAKKGFETSSSMVTLV